MAFIEFKTSPNVRIIINSELVSAVTEITDPSGKGYRTCIYTHHAHQVLDDLDTVIAKLNGNYKEPTPLPTPKPVSKPAFKPVKKKARR